LVEETVELGSSCRGIRCRERKVNGNHSRRLDTRRLTPHVLILEPVANENF
jgi:hypothetical protein